jgi:hypothetical protein
MTLVTQQIHFDWTHYTDKLRANGVDEKTTRAQNRRC